MHKYFSKKVTYICLFFILIGILDCKAENDFLYNQIQKLQRQNMLLKLQNEQRIGLLILAQNELDKLNTEIEFYKKQNSILLNRVIESEYKKNNYKRFTCCLLGSSCFLITAGAVQFFNFITGK